MAPRTSAVALALLVAAAVLLPGSARAALTCTMVYNTLMPCLGYVQSGGTVPPGCCSGIQDLLSRANNTPDRRAVCSCLKNVASSASGGPYVNRAAGLPGKCRVTLPYKLNTNVNCNTIT